MAEALAPRFFTDQNVPEAVAHPPPLSPQWNYG